MVSPATYPIVDGNGVEHGECTAQNAFGVLANPYRRTTLAALDKYDASRIDVDELAADLADATDLTSDAWRRQLHRAHLPLLDNTGLVDYDTDNGTIRTYECTLISELLAVVETVAEETVRNERM